jgi:hypothetical protein
LAEIAENSLFYFTLFLHAEVLLDDTPRVAAGLFVDEKEYTTMILHTHFN